MVDDLLEELEKFIKRTKKVHKLLYQLAFIATGEGKERDVALEYLREMVEHGLITPRQMKKAIEDAKRYRGLIDLMARRPRGERYYRELEEGGEDNDNGY